MEHISIRMLLAKHDGCGYQEATLTRISIRMLLAKHDVKGSSVLQNDVYFNPHASCEA